MKNKVDTNKKVAVIMSVYKSDNPIHFKQAIDSILNQSICCDLYLFRDGLVSNELQSIIDGYISSNDIFLLYTDINGGLALAMNTLIDSIVDKEYDFIARMDSDDISHKERILKQIKYLEKNPDVDICGTFCKEFGASYALEIKELPTSHTELLNFSITRCPFIHPTVMFRAKVFSLGFRYPIDTALTEDMAFWFKLLNSGFKFGNCDEVLLDYRLNENTVERRKGFGKAKSEFSIRFYNMLKMKRFNFKNATLISARLFLHMLPVALLKLAYKVSR